MLLTQKTPNAWSCLPTAFAITLGFDVDEIIHTIGDDGSHEAYPSLPEPFKRQGFHPQQLIKLCRLYHMAVTRIEMMPTASPQLHRRWHASRDYDIGGWDWFSQNLFDGEGVVECRKGSGVGHAVAFQGGGTFAKICDPATGETFDMDSLADAEKRDLFMFALWRIEGLEE